MRKFQCLLFVMRRSYICYHIICITVPLRISSVVTFTEEIINGKHIFLCSVMQIKDYWKLDSKRKAMRLRFNNDVKVYLGLWKFKNGSWIENHDLMSYTQNNCDQKCQRNFCQKIDLIHQNNPMKYFGKESTPEFAEVSM